MYRKIVYYSFNTRTMFRAPTRAKKDPFSTPQEGGKEVVKGPPIG
jgi:hypothetical protein